MKNIIKTLILVMALILALAAFTGCELFEKECTHEGTTELIPSVIPTCTETGMSLGTKCTKCGEVILEPQVTPVRGHDKTTLLNTTADCVTAGVETWNCGFCGEDYDVEVEAYGHDLVDVGAKDATCEADGNNAHKACSNCDYTEGKEVFPGGHTYGEADENGNKTCDRCGEILVSTPAGLQAALDNAVKGTTIRLTENVAYGVVYLRPSANEDVTKVVDWVGNNYRYETYSLFEDLTIIGAEGATIDAIEIEGGTYYNTEHSQSEQYPIMLSLIELKNVTLYGITFTGKGGYDPQGHGNAINLSEQHTKVSGLNIINCTLEDPDNNARLVYRTGRTDQLHTYTYGEETFEFYPTMSDIYIEGCVLNGGYIGIELRETENLVIVYCEFNVANRNILLPVNTGCTYSGVIEIAANVSNNAQERFLRADGIGEAEFYVYYNQINDYQGADLDYIKATGVTNPERDTVLVGYQDSITDGSEEGGREFTVVVQ